MLREGRAEFSPIAQRSASTTLDLPQPFGPTMPVSPGKMSKETGSAKLLNPAMRRRLKRTGKWPPWRGQLDADCTSWLKASKLISPDALRRPTMNVGVESTEYLSCAAFCSVRIQS